MMKSIKTLVASRGDLWQIVRFMLVGFVNTGVDFAVFTMLVGFLQLDHLLSQMISYSCGVINSYILNRTWTFRIKTRVGIKEFAKFASVNMTSLGVSLLALYIAKDILGINVYLAKIAATLCALVINFLGSKLFVFKN